MLNLSFLPSRRFDKAWVTKDYDPEMKTSRRRVHYSKVGDNFGIVRSIFIAPCSGSVHTPLGTPECYVSKPRRHESLVAIRRPPLNTHYVDIISRMKTENFYERKIGDELAHLNVLVTRVSVTVTVTSMDRRFRYVSHCPSTSTGSFRGWCILDSGNCIQNPTMYSMASQLGFYGADELPLPVYSALCKTVHWGQRSPVKAEVVFTERLGRFADFWMIPKFRSQAWLATAASWRSIISLVCSDELERVRVFLPPPEGTHAFELWATAIDLHYLVGNDASWDRTDYNVVPSNNLTKRPRY